MILSTKKYKNTQKERIAVYGSLRKGMYNYRFFENGMTYIKTTQIEGFDLYSLGAYPYVVKGNGNLIVDIMEVTPQTKQSIDLMELGAGYQSSILTIDDQPTTIYIFNQPINDAIVEHVDWVKHKTH